MNRRDGTSVLMVVEQLRRPVPGGIGTYTRGLLGGLRALEQSERDRGEEPPVSVTLCASRSTPDPLGAFGRPIRTVALPSPLLTWCWDRGVLRSPRGFDVVHGVSLASPPPRAPSRLVVMVHDLAWRAYPAATTRRGRRWHEAALRRALERATAFVTPSRAVAAELIAAGAAPETVSVIAEGADHLAPPDTEGAGAILAASGVEGPYLLTVSTLEPRKNLRRLLDAYRAARSELPAPLPLVVAGPLGWGDPGLEDAGDGVVPVGHVEGSALAGLYAGATAFAYVPLVEGFGLPPLEAMSVGTPVVASSTVPSVTEATDEPSALLVDPLDADDIAAGLVSVVRDGQLVERLRRAGSALVAGRPWRGVAAEHVALWCRL